MCAVYVLNVCACVCVFQARDALSFERFSQGSEQEGGASLVNASSVCRHV